MAGGHTIEGLIKWARREEWKEGLQAAVERHFGATCREAGIDLGDLSDLVGESVVANLWGCAFEDFVSSGPDERNVAVDYLKRRGWTESADTRAYIEALRHSTISLYEVSEIVIDEGFTARDLIRGGEPVRVFERSATHSLKPWDRIAARVVHVLGKTQITGALMLFDPELAEVALELIQQGRKKARTRSARASRPRAGDEHAPVSPADPEPALAEAAALFSALWLDDALSGVLEPALPEMRNTDGEEIEFITLYFPLQSKAKLPAIRAALDALPALRKENDSFWNWLEPRRKPLKRAPKTANFNTWSITMDDGSNVLGNVEITARAVTLQVNSQRRAARGRALLEPALAGLVREPLIERESIQQMMARDSGSAEHEAEPPPFPPEDMRKIVHQVLNDQYRRTLDDPIPALGNRSPRHAARSAKGREKVVAWLKKLENSTGRHEPDDPMSGYDFTWMWAELGVLEYRR